jgi:hypothetical protein
MNKYIHKPVQQRREDLSIIVPVCTLSICGFSDTNSGVVGVDRAGCLTMHTHKNPNVQRDAIPILAALGFTICTESGSICMIHDNLDLTLFFFSSCSRLYLVQNEEPLTVCHIEIRSGNLNLYTESTDIVGNAQQIIKSTPITKSLDRNIRVAITKLELTHRIRCAYGGNSRKPRSNIRVP